MILNTKFSKIIIRNHMLRRQINMKFKKLNKKWIILVIIIVAVIGIVVAKHGKKQVAQVNKEIQNVKVQKITTQNISSEVQYAGKLEAVKSVTVSPKNSGKIAT